MAQETIAYRTNPDGTVTLADPATGKETTLPENEAVEKIRGGWNPADGRAGAGEAFARGVASSLTFGLSEHIANGIASVGPGVARDIAKDRLDAAAANLSSALSTGDSGIIAQAEAAYTAANLQHTQLAQSGKSAETAHRLRSLAMMDDHPLAHALGSVAGVLVPGGPIGLVGKAVAKGKGFGSVLARAGAEGAAMGATSAIEETGITGVDLTAGKLATETMKGAGIGVLFGLGGIAIGKGAGVASKLWSAEEKTIREAVAQKAIAGKRLQEMSDLVSGDRILMERLERIKAAGVRAAEGAEGAAKQAAQQDASAFLETLKTRYGYAGEFSPAYWSAIAAKAEADVASATEKLVGRAVAATGGRAAPLTVGGVIGAASGGLFSNEKDPMDIVLSTLKGALIGSATRWGLDKVARGAIKLGVGQVERAVANGGAQMAPLTKLGTLLGPAGRAATDIATETFSRDGFDKAAKDAIEYAQAADTIARGYTSALVNSGYDPVQAQVLGDRKAAALRLLADKAAAGDRQGFATVAATVADPASVAKDGRFDAEKWEVIRQLEPDKSKAISVLARQVLADRTIRLTGAQRAAIETMAGRRGMNTGTIQQAAFGGGGEQGGDIGRKAIPPASGSQALEQRVGGR